MCVGSIQRTTICKSIYHHINHSIDAAIDALVKHELVNAYRKTNQDKSFFWNIVFTKIATSSCSCTSSRSFIGIKYIVNYQYDIFLPKDTSTNRKSINVHPKTIKFLLTLSTDEKPKMEGMRKLLRCFFMFYKTISLFILSQNYFVITTN